MHNSRPWIARATPLLALSSGLLVAACGGSSETSPGSSSSGANPSTNISTASVSGLGTVLVNGAGMTLYTLSSEAGGKLTCTDDNGCTKVWPDTELPSGTTSATAGGSAQSSQLGTVKAASGNLYVTYGGFPLYTYSGDTGPAQSHGQGITSFGGTWYAIAASGQPVKAAASSGGGY